MEPKGSLSDSQVPVTYSYPDNRAPFATAWRVLRLRMEQRYPIWMAAANILINPLTPNDHYSGCTAPLTSKRCILYIYSTNIGTEYFKHGIYSPIFLFKMQYVS